MAGKFEEIEVWRMAGILVGDIYELENLPSE
jgi:hypothetical protein